MTYQIALRYVPPFLDILVVVFETKYAVAQKEYMKCIVMNNSFF